MLLPNESDKFTKEEATFEKWYSIVLLLVSVGIVILLNYFKN